MEVLIDLLGKVAWSSARALAATAVAECLYTRFASAEATGDVAGSHDLLKKVYQNLTTTASSRADKFLFTCKG